MRIFWQSFVDASVNAPYMARLSEYLNNIAASGTTVHVSRDPGSQSACNRRGRR